MTRAKDQKVIDEVKAAIKADLDKGGNDSQYVLKNVKGSAKQAGCWEQFAYVCTRADGERLVDNGRWFVACRYCHVVYSYTSVNGTSTLNRHDCQRLLADPGIASSQRLAAVEHMLNRPTTQKRTSIGSTTAPSTVGQKIQQQSINGTKAPKFKSSTAPKQVVAKVKPSAAEQQLVTKAVALMCYEDLIPFSVVDDVGFQKFVQTVLDLAIQSTRPCDAKELLPDAPALRRYVMNASQTLRSVVFGLVQTQLSDRLPFGFTVDVWRDTIKNNTYMKTTGHFIDKEFVFHSRVLQVKTFYAENGIAAKIVDGFQECLDEFGIDEGSVARICADNGANSSEIESITRMFPSDSGAEYQMSTALRTIFTKTTHGNKTFYRYGDEVTEVFALIEHCKELVKFFKQSDLQSQLDTPLKLAKDTEWTSLYSMLNSINASYIQVSKILLKHPQQHMLSSIDRSLMVELSSFLERFKVSAETLAKFAEPTLHLVIYERYALLQHCQVHTEPVDIEENGATVTLHPDSSAMAAIKTLIAQAIENAWEVSSHHLIAALLDPRQKNRLGAFGISTGQIAVAQSNVEAIMRTVGGVGSSGSNGNAHHQQRPLKRRKMPGMTSIDSSDEEDTTYESNYAYNDNATYAPSQSNLAMQIERELNEYWALKLTRPEKEQCRTGTGLLAWWKANGTKLAMKKGPLPRFPILARAVRHTLCVPASATSHQLSQAAKRQRNNVSASMMHDMLFVRSNHDLLPDQDTITFK